MSLAEIRGSPRADVVNAGNPVSGISTVPHPHTVDPTYAANVQHVRTAKKGTVISQQPVPVSKPLGPLDVLNQILGLGPVGTLGLTSTIIGGGTTVIFGPNPVSDLYTTVGGGLNDTNNAMQTGMNTVATTATNTITSITKTVGGAFDFLGDIGKYLPIAILGIGGLIVYSLVKK